ncbi:MAG: hypothetical protein WD063_18725 [Pirellulales bacterium]
MVRFRRSAYGTRRPRGAALGYNSLVSDVPRNRRSLALRLATLLVVAAVLAALSFWLRGAGRDASAVPLYPNDVLSTWHKGSAAQKRATAELLVAQMQRDGIFGPLTEAALKDPRGTQKLVDEVVVSLDSAGHRNKKTYAPPSQSLLVTAEGLAETMGWNK